MKVSVNGEHFCTAGAVDLGVLSVNISATGLLGPESKKSRDDETVDVHVHVGGLTARQDQSDDHLNWNKDANLATGDRIEVEICEVEQADPPKESHPKDERRAEARLKEQFEYAKEFYLRFRERFEKCGDARL